MNITVTVNAPELAAAIQALAQSLTGNQLSAPVAAQQAVSTPAFNIPVQQPAPASQQIAVPPTQPYPDQQAAGVPPTVPTSGAAPVPGAVPTAGAPTYTMDQLAVAATQLVDAGRQAEIVQLLASFGVQALTALPKEHYGAFATQLRAMGAKI